MIVGAVLALATRRRCRAVTYVYIRLEGSSFYMPLVALCNASQAALQASAQFSPPQRAPATASSDALRNSSLRAARPPFSRAAAARPGPGFSPPQRASSTASTGHREQLPWLK